MTCIKDLPMYWEGGCLKFVRFPLDMGGHLTLLKGLLFLLCVHDRSLCMVIIIIIINIINYLFVDWFNITCI
jgi:hypothetical protein